MAGTVRNIILDCDPGIDDALALAAGLAAPELEIKAVASVFGEVSGDAAAFNLRGLMALAGRADIPVYAGAREPLVTCQLRDGSPHAHGFDGLGDADLLHGVSVAALQGENASVHLDQMARATDERGGITVVTLGPLTNLCLALKLYPDIDLHVRDVIVMGGNPTGAGNHTLAAERNVYRDPEAAAAVFSARWRVRLIGCDVIESLSLREHQIARISKGDGFAGLLMSRCSPFYLEYFKDEIGREEIRCHSLATIAALVAPELFSFDRRQIIVETQGVSRGKTWCFPSGLVPDGLSPQTCRGNVEICTGVRAAELTQAIEGMLTN